MTNKEYLVLSMSAASGIVTEQYFTEYPDMLIDSFRLEDIKENVETAQGLAAWALFENRGGFYALLDDDAALKEDRQELLDYADDISGLLTNSAATAKSKLSDLLKWLTTSEGLQAFERYVEIALLSANNENKYRASIAGEHRYKLLGAIDGTFKVIKAQRTLQDTELFVEATIEMSGEQKDTAKIVPLKVTLTAYFDINEKQVSNLANWSIDLRSLLMEESEC